MMRTLYDKDILSAVILKINRIKRIPEEGNFNLSSRSIYNRMSTHGITMISYYSLIMRLMLSNGMESLQFNINYNRRWLDKSIQPINQVGAA